MVIFKAPVVALASMSPAVLVKVAAVKPVPANNSTALPLTKVATMVPVDVALALAVVEVIDPKLALRPAVASMVPITVPLVRLMSVAALSKAVSDV